MNEKFEALQTASEYIVKLKSGINKAVEYFQAGEENKGCNLVIQITEGIQWISEVIVLTKEVQKEEINLEDMNSKLSEIVEAFQNQDFILVGDLFEYELLPIIDEIEDKINKSIIQ